MTHTMLDLDTHRTHITSHRGGARLWSENSLSAFRNTARMPVERVEFDIHPTADGRIVVLHDATLDRTTNGSGAVGDKSWAELQSVRVNGTEDERILLLEEVLEVFKSTGQILHIEFKANPSRRPYPALPRLAAALLSSEGVLDRVVATSFQLETLAGIPDRQRLRGLAWLVNTVVWHDAGLAGVIALAKSHGVTSVSIHETLLDSACIAAVKAAGLGVGAYAAHEDEAIGKVLALNVDFFTTDRPDRAMAIREARGR